MEAALTEAVWPGLEGRDAVSAGLAARYTPQNPGACFHGTAAEKKGPDGKGHCKAELA